MAVAGAGLLLAVGFFVRNQVLSWAGPGPTGRQVTFEGNVTAVTLSPDGEMIAYVRSNGELVVQEIRDGLPVRLAERAGGVPRWRADGSEVLIRLRDPEAGWALYRIPRAGGERTRVASDSFRGRSGFFLQAYDFLPRSDSYVILTDRQLYIGNKPETIRNIAMVGEVDSVIAEGRLIDLSPPDLARATEGQFRPAFDIDVSSDGRWVAVQGHLLGRDVLEAVATISVDGAVKNVIELGESAQKFPPAPQWAPSADALYFVRAEGGGSSIYKVPIDRWTGSQAGTAKRVRKALPELFAWDISRDGTSLIYVSGSTRSPQLRLARVERAGATGAPSITQLTNDSYRHGTPRISPDGQSVAYVKGPDQEGILRGEIYIRSVAGTTERRMTNGRPDGRHVHDMRWSPDGTRVAILDHGDPSKTPDPAIDSYFDQALWVIDLGSGEARRVEMASGFPSRFPDPYVGLVAWSSDGSQLVTPCRRARINRCMVDLVSGTVSDVPGALPEGENRSPVFSPVFSPDGEHIAVDWDSRGDDEDGLRIISLVDETQIRLTDERARPLHWTADGTIYAVRSDTIYSIASAGGPLVPYAVLPFSCRDQDVAMGTHEMIVVCSDSEGLLDVWVIDNFDGDNTR